MKNTVCETMSQTESIKTAKKWIKEKPMPSSLEKGFREKGLNDRLDQVYLRTAALVAENADQPEAVIRHLKQILPCIAFYEILLEKEAGREQALAIFETYCFTKIRKMSKALPVIMKIPGLYQKVPGIMNKMVDSTFGPAAGFEGVPVECKNGFAVDMVKCPYVEVCKKYGCLELAQFFCKSDDICYGNLHPKLIWGRTKTLGMGGDCCDFKLYIKED